MRALELIFLCGQSGKRLQEAGDERAAEVLAAAGRAIGALGWALNEFVGESRLAEAQEAWEAWDPTAGDPAELIYLADARGLCSEWIDPLSGSS